VSNATDRHFTDERGVRWSVREIIPASMISAPRVALARPAYQSGWLLFECEGEKRRLAPYPPEWRELPEAELETLCDGAHPVALDARARFPRPSAPPGAAPR
jgi:hypothetical protein